MRPRASAGAPRPPGRGSGTRRLAAPALLATCALAAHVAPAAVDPSGLGPWDVGHRAPTAVDAARDDRPLDLQIWYPVDPEDADGPPRVYSVSGLPFESAVARTRGAVSDAGPFPLLVFSHGSGSFNLQSLELCETLATHGFVVVAPNHTGNTIFGDEDSFEQSAIDRPLDVSFLTDDMLARNGEPENAFYGRIDPERIGVLGHSFGGYTALAMAAGIGPIAPDERVRAILPISGRTSFFSDEELARVEIPILFLGGTLDTVVPLDPETVRGFAGVSTPRFRYRADIVGATHTHFSNACLLGRILIDLGFPMEVWDTALDGAAEPLIEPYLESCSPEAFPFEEVLRLQNLYAVSFFRRHLRGEPEFSVFLTTAYAEENEPDVVFVPEPPAALAGDAALAALLALARGARSRRSRRYGAGAEGSERPRGATPMRAGSAASARRSQPSAVRRSS